MLAFASVQGRRALLLGLAVVCAVSALLLAMFSWLDLSAVWLRTAGMFWPQANIRDKPNAVIVLLAGPDRMTEALKTLQALEDRFNHRLQYPYVVITETDISMELQQKADYITESRITFATFPEDMWGPPSSLDPVRVQASVDKIGFSLGYRSMCRFFSGFFWKHPALLQYEWIWRLDVDIEWHCDIPYDPIALMEESGKLYGFQHINRDTREVQESLASNVSTFLAEYTELLPEESNMHFQWDDPAKALAGESSTEDWLRWTFNNNWEISHRSFWESPIYTAFFNHLDAAGGFFYERWGDAPVHSLAVSFALRKDQVMYFNDTGYQHQGWEYNCPDLPRCGCYKDPASLSWRDNSHLWFDA